MNIDEILEAATADFFWVPSHVQTVERPELAYSYSSSPSAEHNRVVRARPTLAEPAALVSEVAQAHRGVASRWCLNPMSDTPTMRRALVDAGYVEGHRHIAYAIRATDYQRQPPPDVEIHQVETVADLEILYQLKENIFGYSPPLSDDDVAAELAACTGTSRRVARFIAYHRDEPAGTGGMTFFDELNFALIWAGGVVEHHRGNGVYTTLLTARARTAVRHGIEILGLYARTNTSAPIVAAHGFDEHGAMTYFEREEC